MHFPSLHLRQIKYYGIAIQLAYSVIFALAFDPLKKQVYTVRRAIRGRYLATRKLSITIQQTYLYTLGYLSPLTQLTLKKTIESEVVCVPLGLG